jgi:hypothetical protein|uniref:Uncharacterized protein n=1 Tax=Desulfobacca acetoxidans TaxID=60893 RepID=A0A7V6A445_9BACT
MSKKKQLDGKKTKLAKLPLTEALSRQMEEPVASPTVAVTEVKSAQPAFSWESLEEGAAGLLAAAYALMIQDLLSLKNEVPWASEEVVPPVQIVPSTNLPAHQVKEALRQAKKELSDLYRLLSA